MSKIYFISDTHFNHKNIIKYCCRPFDNTAQMDKAIIKNWNKTVRKDDTVYFLGDFYLGANAEEIYEKYSKKLKGHIYFLRGNHDRSKASVKKYFNVIDMPTLLDYEGYHFILSHQPLYNGQIPEGYINIHGHIHDKILTESSYTETPHVNISADVINFTPICIDDIIKRIKR